MLDVTAGGTAAGRVSGGDTDSVQKAVSGSKTLTSKEYISQEANVLSLLIGTERVRNY